MIFDNLDNKANYSGLSKIKLILDFIDRVDKNNIPVNSQFLLDSGIHYNLITFKTKPYAECLFEAHQRYMDLHYILEGTEGIGTASVKSLSIAKPYDSTNDISFYHGYEDGIYYLKPGQFMVCWPEDAHKVAIMKDQPITVKKIVFKIPLT